MTDPAVPPPPCPGCGEPLQPVVTDDPQTPPWVCRECDRGWWNAELAPDAARFYRPEFRDFGRGSQHVVRAAVAELADAVATDAARRRGKSATAPGQVSRG